MAEGIRIRAVDRSGQPYTALASRVLEVEDPSRPVIRDGVSGPKIYRLVLDDTASVIVSHRVWARLQAAMGMAGLAEVRFVIANPVARPPGQVLSFDRADDHVSHRINESGLVVPTGLVAVPQQLRS